MLTQDAHVTRPMPRRVFLELLAVAGVAPHASGQTGAAAPTPRRVFITGSTDGLGLAAARRLIDQGHAVLLHARTKERAASLDGLAKRALGVVIGDLGSAAETRALSESVNRIGRMDAVIHNAGTVGRTGRGTTPEGHSTTLAVNALAPYLLTALMARPARLIYLSSSMHRGADASLSDIDWTARPWDANTAYSESKLYVTALAFAIARRWRTVLSNAVDPGWVPTKMGGPEAPDPLALGHATQEWLAVSDDSAAKVSGHYWHHLRRTEPAKAVLDVAFQERLLARFAEMTGVALAPE